MVLRSVVVAALAALLGACATTNPYASGPYTNAPYGGGAYGGGSYGGGPQYYDDRPARCGNCGTIDRIERVSDPERTTSGGGAVLGAIIGGALGNQVGSGDGRTAATVAGAVAGGLVGNEIERNQPSAGNDTWYEVFVRMDSGERIVTRQYGISGLREGSRVEIRGDAAYPL